MSDDTIISPGAGGDEIRTDEVGTNATTGASIKIAAVKIFLGLKGNDLGPVSEDNPFPTADPGTHERLDRIIELLEELCEHFR